ncbi:DUF2975 domain-containing protein [Aeromicrobium piscarium]|uniref:DUF2975 domain-containing protein n=1 Tax=Aeromicrobium piscarium TaxID=2590901 RepID=A0A554RTT8_9ACTN|nr:DUF2975 domain-containing protein [Aeromicrobium piscarium]
MKGVVVRSNGLWNTERGDLWAVIVVGAAVALGSVWSIIMSLIEIVPNSDVPVRVQLVGETFDLPIGPDGAPVEAGVDEITVHVSDLPVASHVSAMGAAIVPSLAVIAVAVCVLLLCRNLLRGEFFSRTNTRLVITTSMVIAFGWVITLLFTVMASNGALAQIEARPVYESVQFHLDWYAVLAAMAVGALGAAFHAGERMQRDTEGLV